MKWLVACSLLMAGCGSSLFPNRAPELTHVNGLELPEPIRLGGFIILSATPGQTETYTFQIDDNGPFDVYWPEQHPGWSWNADSLTATWDVPDVIVDPDPYFSMLIVDRDATDPRYTQVYVEVELPVAP